nr:DoxX family protein [Actinopolymorpha alba]
MSTTLVRDLALLLARIGLGIVLVTHGWQKFSDQGLSATAGGFSKMGIPLPTLSAYFATFVELIGGAALIIGFAVPIAGILVALNMAGAFLFVHSGNGVFVNEGGFELVLVIALTGLLLAAFGSGRIGVDALLFGRRRSSADATSHAAS